MVLIRKRNRWELPEHEATPEHIFMNRRSLIKSMGIAGLSALGVLANAGNSFSSGNIRKPKFKKGKSQALKNSNNTNSLYPAKRNSTFTLDRPLTDEKIASKYNNFYEFTPFKKIVSLRP